MKLKIKSQSKTVLFFGVFIIALMSIVPIKDSSSIDDPVYLAAWEPNTNWHNGSAQSTPEADVIYEQVFRKDDTTGVDLLEQSMWIVYKDGTYSSAGFTIRMQFNEGGLDLVNNQVLDWSKMSYTEPTFISKSPYGFLREIKAAHKFNGFYIVNGSVNEVELEKVGSGSEYYTSPKNQIGQIKTTNKNIEIGEVSLSTEVYDADGVNRTESVGRFSVFIDGAIGNDTVDYDILVEYQFEVRHRIDQTSYKYGVDIDWSAYKEFPTKLPMSEGDDYCLVASDRLHVSDGDFALGKFDINANNDTAIFMNQEEQVCTQHFTTEFSIYDGLQNQNTRRIYIADADTGGNYGGNSRVFVCYGGFKYNQSTGITFDPSVIIPCSLTINIIIWTSAIGIIALAAVSIVLIIRKKKRK